MIKAVSTNNEQQRLEALKMTKLLDTFPEELYDQFTQLASQICKTPIALLSLVDSDRQWFKSKVGVSDSETTRDISFCGHAIQNLELFEVQDSKKDERFHDNPLVTGDLDIRFYAGAPIIIGDGLAIGTLCVADNEPRILTDQQKNQLQNLSRILSSIIHFKSLGDQYEVVLNSMHEAVVIHDSTGKVIDYNMRALEILGVKDEDLYLTSPSSTYWMSRLFSKDTQTSETSPVVVAIRERRIVSNVVMELRQREDSSKWLLVNAVPDFDHLKNDIVQIIVTFSDITLLKQSEEKLAHSHRMVALGELAAGIAHEINNPLTVIQAKMRKLERAMSPQEEEYADFLVDIRKTLAMADRIGKIVKSVQSMSRKDEEVRRSDLFLIKELIQDSLEMASAFRGSRDVTFSFEDFSLGAQVAGSFTEISQAVSNILSNAIQAIGEIESKWIKIKAELSGSEVLVRITDSGNGIPAELRKRIMNPFFTTKQPGEGTGLGLSLAFQYIARSGGQLYLNEQSENTEFVIQLPLSRN